MTKKPSPRMGRPPKYANAVRVNIYIDKEHHDKVKAAGVNLSDLINAYLKRWKPKEK